MGRHDQEARQLGVFRPAEMRVAEAENGAIVALIS